MPGYSYFPILKTTDSELKAFEHLPDGIKGHILPIFELTKSKRSKKNPIGDIEVRVSKLKELVKKNYFILDLSVEESLINTQIKDMLYDSTNGFGSWTKFISNLINAGLNVIPVIHYSPYDLDAVRIQIQTLSQISPLLAFRIERGDAAFVSEVLKHIAPENLILIIDAKFIKLENAQADKSGIFTDTLQEIISANGDKFKAIVCALSGFPSTVVAKGYGGDETGSFPMIETATSTSLSKNFNVVHGDYSSVHPIRYDTGWGWVPRIDFCSEDTYFYHRIRREDGGYAAAAKLVKSDERYHKTPHFSLWGDEQIALAANGTPERSNPAHWIAVRINLYIARQFLRLRKSPQVTL